MLKDIKCNDLGKFMRKIEQKRGISEEKLQVMMDNQVQIRGSTERYCLIVLFVTRKP